MLSFPLSFLSRRFGPPIKAPPGFFYSIDAGSVFGRYCVLSFFATLQFHPPPQSFPPFTWFLTYFFDSPSGDRVWYFFPPLFPFFRPLCVPILAWLLRVANRAAAPPFYSYCAAGADFCFFFFFFCLAIYPFSWCLGVSTRPRFSLFSSIWTSAHFSNPTTFPPLNPLKARQSRRFFLKFNAIFLCLSLSQLHTRSSLPCPPPPGHGRRTWYVPKLPSFVAFSRVFFPGFSFDRHRVPSGFSFFHCTFGASPLVPPPGIWLFPECAGERSTFFYKPPPPSLPRCNYPFTSIFLNAAFPATPCGSQVIPGHLCQF